MAAEKLSLVEQLQDRIGEIIILDGRKYRVIGDDFHSKPLKKEWDYILEDVETKQRLLVFAEKIANTSKVVIMPKFSDSSELPIQ